MMRIEHGYIVFINMLGIMGGMINSLFLENKWLHGLYIIFITLIMLISSYQKKESWIRPIPFFTLSFLVFVWMRYILNLVFKTDVVTTGSGITIANVNLVAIFLGSAINVVYICSEITESILENNNTVLFRTNERLVIPKIAEIVILILALFFMGIFLIDSINKINILRANNYLSISEGIMIQGYRYFSIGKHLLLLWVIFSKYEDRFFVGATILMVAGIGYLMRGARGYAIMYIFTWLFFLSFKKKIKAPWLIVLGFSLIFLANYILSYRLGWNVAYGFKNIVLSTLNSQGASIEPVFGSVIFKNQIKKEFGFWDLFIRNDFGIIVDRVRGTGFTMGGFGSSFYAEVFFGGFPFGYMFLLLAGGCLGYLEHSYKIVKTYRFQTSYLQTLFYMTIPNLIYIGRSNIKDFVFKTLFTIILLAMLQHFAAKKYVK